MNEKLKFAYGYVLAFMSLTIIAYLVFVGMVYFTGGDMLLSTIITGVGIALMAMACIGLQRLKGTENHFSRCVKFERFLLPLLIVLCLAALIPFTHFFTVQRQGEQVKEHFTQMLDESQQMLTEYDKYAKDRLRQYRNSLRATLRGKNRDKLFDKEAIASIKGADTIMMSNMERAMQLQLCVGEDSLRQGAAAWLDEARQGVTVWNVFLVGNVKKIREAVEQWHATMVAGSEQTFPGESVKKDHSAAFNSTHFSEISKRLDAIDAIYTDFSFPRPLALLAGIVAMLLLFLPYRLQERNSRSRVRLLGGIGKKTPLDVDHDYDNIHRIQLVSEVSIPIGMNDGPLTPLEQMRDIIATSDHPAATLAELTGNGALTPEQLLQLIHQDCNLLDAATISQCLDNGLFTREQLLQGNEYLEGFVNMLGTPMTDLLPADKHIENLDTGCTEFYFWGIPSSGKTCAIGAVINAAREKTVAKNITVMGDCQGYDYLVELMNVFKGRDTYCVLPGRTPVDANFAMRLNLTDCNDRLHPVTIIDMAGELFCYLYWRDHGIYENCTMRHDRAFQSFENIMLGNRTANRKFHFFIIEYGVEKKKYKGFSQDDYLCYGLQYLEHTGVLAEATDGICVIVTKYDHLFTKLVEDEDINNHLSAYLYRNYGGFLRLLRQYCQKYEINGGVMPDPVPFCIGDVCFRNYCRISTEYAKDIVKIILRESKGFRRDRMARIEDQLRK